MNKLILLYLLALFSCKKKNNTEPAETKSLTYCDSIPWSPRSYGTVTDIDGNTYKTIKIGNQTWMAENLRTTRYSNGDLIPYVKGNDEWSNLTTGAYCWYIDSIDIDDDGTKDYGVSYQECAGNLYNFYVVEDSRNVCPTGWHVASEAEWEELIEFDKQYSGGNVGTSLSPVEGWVLDGFNIGYQFNDELGFRALPIGYRFGSYYNNQESYSYFGANSLWWTSREPYFSEDVLYAFPFVLTTVYEPPSLEIEFGTGGIYQPGYGLSIRCVKD